MIDEPWFWRSSSLAARFLAAGLSPVAAIYDAIQRLSAHRAKSACSPVPVICIGNATLGGVGKTPFALMLHALLAEKVMTGTFLTRGYGGRASGPMQINPSLHSSDEVGDEPLLLASKGPTWLARNRAAGVQAAVTAGADFIIMDDGYQNFSIEKSFSILLLNAADPQGNGRIFPAGPLREPLSRAVRRADLVAFVVENRETVVSPETKSLAKDRPSLRVWLEPTITTEADEVTNNPNNSPPGRVVAFCGIGQPHRFFALLKTQGFEVVERFAFPDHHRLSPNHLKRMRLQAREKNADLITTEKDFTRLSVDQREGIRTLPVAMYCDKTDLLVEKVLDVLDKKRRISGA